jgi:hypothetical protein
MAGQNFAGLAAHLAVVPASHLHAAPPCQHFRGLAEARDGLHRLTVPHGQEALPCRSFRPPVGQRRTRTLLTIRILHSRTNKLGHTDFILGYVYPFSFLRYYHALNYEGVSSNLSHPCV